MQEGHQKESGVSLRPVSKDDVSFLKRVANDPSLMDIFCDEPSDEGYWQDVVDIWQADSDEEDFIIIRMSDRTEMGWLGLNGLASGEETAWLKMIALLPEFWGHGYGSDAIRHVKAHLLSKGLARIRLWTDQCNERSQTCYRRNGFVILDHRWTATGTQMVVRDRVLMECVLSDGVEDKDSEQA